MRVALILVIAMCLAGCATLNGVPQTPCQRATRAADTAHALANAAAVAGADAVVIAKLDAAAGAADRIAAGICMAADRTVSP